jgi:hypothetical protein
MVEHADRICQALPGASLDAAIGQLMIDTLTPLAVEAALTVAAELEQRADYAGQLRADYAGQLRAAVVERARYHADPANRLVADTGEADWNTAPRALNEAKDAYDKAQNAAAANLAETQKTRIRTLVTDFPAIWNDPATPQRERKRMTRLLLTDVTVTRNAKTITCNMRWQGGQDRTITLPVPKTAWELRQTAPHVVEAIDQRARRDQPMGAQHGWKQPGQCSQDRPVDPVRLGPGDLTPEHRDRMTENHDLRVFDAWPRPSSTSQPKTRIVIK